MSEAEKFVEEVANMDLQHHEGTGTDKLIRKARRIRKKIKEVDGIKLIDDETDYKFRQKIVDPPEHYG